MKNRIGLGTVQFGQDYGISNSTGKVPKEEVFNILRFASDCGIDTIDTAYAYGDSECVIGAYVKEASHSFNIISKLGALSQEKKENVVSRCLESLDRLCSESIYGYMFHSFGDFVSNPSAFDAFWEMKSEGKIKKIGFSLYSPCDLERLLEQNVSFDLIQVPYSVFDRRFSPLFAQAKDKGIEIHVRSIFLQGLAFLKQDKLLRGLEGAKKPLFLLSELSENLDVPVSAICLNYVLQNSLIDKVIIGVDSLEQLKENLDDLRYFDSLRGKKAFDDLVIEDEKILLPQHWRKV